ncbi:hypothetical protein MMC28_004348 [Mycoblastus sanguinarius]|nr:hypothetical protein [Mycoblastus sanguinarius]
MAGIFENSGAGSGIGRATRRSSGTPISSKSDARKLRASCDGCYLAKVKCTKEPPTCGRCSSHGISCQYSPSQRVGKPRRLPSDGQLLDAFSHSHDSASVGDRTSNSPSNVSTNAQLFDWNFDPAGTTSDARAAIDMDMGQEITLAWQQTLSSSENDRAGFPDDSRRTSSFPTPSTSTQPSTNEVQPPHWASQPPSVFADDFTSLQRVLPPLTDTPSMPNQMPTPDATTPPSCTCSATTFEILRTLHDRSSNPSTPFDTVLATNKGIVSRISNILNCTCTHDPTSIITLAASITKMLSWYQNICRMPSTQPDTSSSTHPTPIILGSYRLEGEDEDAVKMQVVLNELRKVDTLMARFGERFREMRAKQESAFYGDLISFLRKKLREVVGALQRDLKMEFADVS